MVLADQFSKHWAINSLDQESRHIFWLLDFRLGYNFGAILGIGGNIGYLFVILAIPIVLGFLGLAVTKSQYFWHQTKYLIAMSLIVGGAVGNSSDRLFRSIIGQKSGFAQGPVVDFIDVGSWPVFNLADASITVGILTFLAFLIENEWQERKLKDKSDYEV